MARGVAHDKARKSSLPRYAGLLLLLPVALMVWKSFKSVSYRAPQPQELAVMREVEFADKVLRAKPSMDTEPPGVGEEEEVEELREEHSGAMALGEAPVRPSKDASPPPPSKAQKARIVAAKAEDASAAKLLVSLAKANEEAKAGEGADARDAPAALARRTGRSNKRTPRGQVDDAASADPSLTSESSLPLQVNVPSTPIAAHTTAEKAATTAAAAQGVLPSTTRTTEAVAGGAASSADEDAVKPAEVGQLKGALPVTAAAGDGAVAGAAGASEHTTKSTKNTPVVIALIGRDVADELPYVLRNIWRLHQAAQFPRTLVMLVENDSKDWTVKVFRDWADRAAKETHGALQGEVRSFEATEGKKSLSVLGRARQVYIDAIRTEHTWAELLIVADTDMCFPWPVDDHVTVLNHLIPVEEGAWSAALANGICTWFLNPPGTPEQITHRGSTDPRVQPLYCDLFALQDIHGGQPQAFNVRLIPGTCTTIPQGAWKPSQCESLGGEAAVPVRTAFGGLGIYRTSALKKAAHCRHDTQSGCEHTPLNMCLHDAGHKIFIIPRLVVNWEGCQGPVLDHDPDYDIVP
jgi:hypothetical protein